MRQLSHPHLLPCFASFVTDKAEIVVVSPLMAYGSLRDLLDTTFSEGLPETALTIIVKQVLLALQYLHLKVSTDYYLKRSFGSKIANFGISTGHCTSKRSS